MPGQWHMTVKNQPNLTEVLIKLSPPWNVDNYGQYLPTLSEQFLANIDMQVHEIGEHKQ
jgi:hypothetical protein